MEYFAEFESLIGIISEIPDEPVEEESTEELLNYPVVHPTGNKYFMVSNFSYENFSTIYW